MQFPTTEKGCRLVEALELQDNIFCVSGVEYVDFSFICFIINCNSTDEILMTFPRTQQLSKISGRFHDVKKRIAVAKSRITSTSKISPYKR